MSDIRFFTDEDVYGDVARILRSHGFDAVSTPEANRLSETDPSQLEWCRQQGRAIVSFNVGHFAAMHTQWAVAGDPHMGIIVSHQRPIGDLMRRLVRLARTLTAEEMVDRLEYLSNWPSA
jgi:hypothetical protein